MLIRFEAANFRSILAPVELSMVAIDTDRVEARPAANINESLLVTAAVFGPNASGKSNVIAAMTWLRNAVRDSLRFWDDVVPVEPFAFADGPERASEFTLEAIIRGVRFEYVVEVDREAVRYEALFHYPEKKRRRVFEREARNLTLQRGLGTLSGTRDLLTDRALVLSIARRFNEPVVSDFARFVLAIQTFGQGTDPRTGPVAYSGTSTRRWFEEPTVANQPALPGLGDPYEEFRADRDQALALLRMADLGIDDVLIDEHESNHPGLEVRGGRTRKQRRIRLVHSTTHEKVPFDFSAESEGTRTWFQLIGPILSALKAGSLLLFDELDSSLHPTLSAQVIRLFCDPATNPSGAQLVFTTHDTSLLNHLNRDEVWLTEKSGDGSTRLGALAEFAGERVRRSQNLEKAYLHGRFGALPDVDRTDVLRALGLIG
ncbi:AAA family ATPase [Micromonospora cathayae]|uniref:AAA family ATPase n=1 Tax=Micromonospora cathayae TaxID=3028804 RepID=A0ABY7ZU89_9ACTN|nr:ATP-binding protein [Micromonospora sp. HUAS 3]WDZ86058.1 AAA family ATPase [Micromonospora sp. HUAS 3]